MAERGQGTGRLGVDGPGRAAEGTCQEARFDHLHQPAAFVGRAQIVRQRDRLVEERQLVAEVGAVEPMPQRRAAQAVHRRGGAAVRRQGGRRLAARGHRSSLEPLDLPEQVRVVIGFQVSLGRRKPSQCFVGPAESQQRLSLQREQGGQPGPQQPAHGEEGLQLFEGGQARPPVAPAHQHRRQLEVERRAGSQPLGGGQGGPEVALGLVPPATQLGDQPLEVVELGGDAL